MSTPAERMLRIFRGYERAHYFADFTNVRMEGKKRIPQYGQVAGPITLEEIESHLAGRRGVLAVPVDEQGKSYFGKIDLDDYALDLTLLAKKVERRRYPLMVERSKSGGAHLGFYPKKPWESYRLREQLVDWASDLGFTKAEIFPKQDRLDPSRDTGAGINLPYFGGDNAENYALDSAGQRLALEQWLDAVENMPERLKAPLGEANVQAAADYLAQFWVEHRRDFANIRVIGTLLRAKIDEAAVEQLVELTREITGDTIDPRRSVASIAADLLSDAKKVPGFTKLTDPTDPIMSREEALELLRLMGAKPPPDPLQGVAFSPVERNWIFGAPPPLTFVVEPVVPSRTVALLAAEPGVGKSNFAMRMTMAVAGGRDFLGMKTASGPALYLALEDHADQVQRNFHWMVNREIERMRAENCTQEAIDAFANALTERLTLQSAAGKELYLVNMIAGQAMQGPVVAALIEALPRPLELLVIDPMSRVNGSEENSNSIGTAIINAAERIADEVGCAVLIVHHVSRAAAKEFDESQFAARGATALVAGARSSMRLMVVGAGDKQAQGFTNCPPEVLARGDLVRLSHNKLNASRRGEPLYLRRQGSDFEVFAPERGAGDAWVGAGLREVFEWWVREGRRPFYQQEVEDLRESIFLRNHLTRAKATAVVAQGRRDRALVETGECKPRTKVSSLTFAEGYDPDEL